jgi:hypothetical protein
MKRLLLTLLIVSITCTVFAQRPNNSLNINKIKISGNITDSETAEPLEYATISLVNERFPEKVQGLQILMETLILIFFLESII